MSVCKQSRETNRSIITGGRGGGRMEAALGFGPDRIRTLVSIRKNGVATFSRLFFIRQVHCNKYINDSSEEMEVRSDSINDFGVSCP